MRLEASCNCGSVRYTCEAAGPVPFMRCYCAYCHKTGSGGFMVNLLADADSLEVHGQAHVKVHRAMLQPEGEAPRASEHERHFCGECGSHLWAFNKRWPTLLHPVASSVDTPLPVPPALTHIFLASKPAWVGVEVGPKDKCFDRFPDESLQAWHLRHGLFER